jgi:hypothetical protein
VHPRLPGNVCFVEGLQEIAILNAHQDSPEKDNLDHNDFLVFLIKDTAAEEYIGCTPKQGRDKEQEEKPLPWSPGTA